MRAAQAGEPQGTWPASTGPLRPGLLLVAIVLLVHANALAASFQFDDFKVIVDFSPVHSLDGWWQDAPRGIRPLLKLSYTLNWVSGFGEAGFHGVNLGIHAFNAVLVLRLGKRLLGPGAGPLFAALLFALHPVQTEAVAYVCGRSVSLMATFYLGALECHVRAGEGRRLQYRLASLALFLGALLVRETALTLPGALLMWDWMTGKDLRASLRDLWPHVTLAVAAVLFAVLHPGYLAFFSDVSGIRSAGSNLLAQVGGTGYLLARTLLPWGQNFDPDLRVPTSPTPALLAGGLALAGLWIAALAGLRRRRLWGFALIWFLFHLLPTNSVFPRLDVANERHLYLPMAGLCLWPASWMETVRGRFQRKALGAGALLLIALGSLTVLRNRVYRDEIALWEDTVRKSPDKARPRNNLGFAYAVAGRKEDGVREFHRALALRPGYRLAERNLEALRPRPSR